MRVQMKETVLGSPDGMAMHLYEAGKVYDMPDPLAEVFLAHSWAVKDKAVEVPEVKEKDGTQASNSPDNRTRKPGRSKGTSQDR